MSKGLKALEDLMTSYYEMCQDLGNNDDQYQRCNLTSERSIIERELKDNENKLAIISEILVDISKGNYSDLNIAIEEIREVLS